MFAPPEEPRSPLALAKDHPIRQASWIWPAPMYELHNCFADFRKDFELAVVPSTVPFWVTADQQYRLWVNGVCVARGPARGYQRSWPVDEVDLAPHLRIGRNWLAIEAYNPGLSTFRYIHQGFAGMLCAGQAGSTDLRSDGSWRMRRSPGRIVHTRRLSMQLDFQEHLRLAQTDRAWIEDPEYDVAWDGRPLIANAQPTMIPVGTPPWLDLEARGIPNLAETQLRGGLHAVALATARCAPGWREWEDASWPWQQEADGLSWSQVEDDGDEEVLIPAAGADAFVAVAVDVGRYVAGTVDISIACAPGEDDGILDLHFHERLVDGRPDRRPPGSGCCVALASRLHLAPGAHRHAGFHILAFSAITLVARGTRGPLLVRLTIRELGYPFRMAGSFAAGDRILERIHAACRRTQRLCALDAYVDTPWREQAQWWGDARIQARTTFHLDDDARLLLRGIRSIAGQEGPFGLTYGHAPTMAHNCVLPDFALTWIMTLWDWHWQTGKTWIIDEQWQRACEVLSYFDRPEARHASGLLRHDQRLWYFGDWADLHRGGAPSFLNLWHLIALQHLARLLACAGRMTDAESVAAVAAIQQSRIEDLLIDAGSGLVRTGLDGEARTSVHDQVLAIMAGVAPQHHDTMVRTTLLPWIRGTAHDLVVPSASWATYALQVLGERGYVQEVVGFIRRHWEPMLATGTTWGGYQWSEDAGGSACHAWTAHPASHLVNWLVGIRQRAAGWTEIDLVPRPMAEIGHAHADIPTPQGMVSAGWRFAGNTCIISASVPSNVDVHLVRPDGARCIWHGGGARQWTVPAPACG